ncbi:MAG: hypothetical protein ACFFER_18420 [Candidatus Thorarchaeota archaeon]
MIEILGIIAAVGTFLIALWEYYKRSRPIIISITSSEHGWPGGGGRFYINFSVENNQQRGVPLSNIRLLRNNVEMPLVPQFLEIEPTIRLNSGDRREIYLEFMEPQGRTLGLQRRISMELIVDWNGRSTSKKFVSTLRGSI